MRHCLLSFCLVILTSLPLCAHDGDLMMEEGNSEGKRSYVKVGLLSSSAGFSIRHWDDASGRHTFDKLTYYDNSALGTSYTAGRDGFSFAYCQSKGENDSVKGRTRSRDILSSYFGRKAGVELFYMDKKGEYLDNPRRYGYEPGAPETKRSDIRQTNFSVNAFYVFSDWFSLRAAFDQCERQLHWDWSFFLMGSLNYNRIRADGSLVPASVDTAENFGDQTGYAGGRYLCAGVLPGIGVTLPFHNFYVTGVAFAGPGLMHQRVSLDSGRSSSACCNLLANIKGGVGYNGPTIFTGLSLSMHSVVGGALAGGRDETQVQFFETVISLFGGIRS